jgi:hypothetical protein
MMIGATGPPPVVTAAVAAVSVPHTAAAFFGLIVPGKPMRTDFVAIDATKYGLSFFLDVPVTTIRELVLFKMPQFDLPAGYGVLCYWQITAVATAAAAPCTTMMVSDPRSTGFELLGALTDAQPSAIFQTGWSEHEQVAELTAAVAAAANSADFSYFSGAALAPMQLQVSIGLSLESLANIQNLGDTVVDRVQQGKLYVAQKVAEDLFQFMLSFDTGHGGNQQGNNNAMMVVPKNIFDRWFQRFKNRFQRDPNFFLRHHHQT